MEHLSKIFWLGFHYHFMSCGEKKFFSLYLKAQEEGINKQPLKSLKAWSKSCGLLKLKSTKTEAQTTQEVSKLRRHLSKLIFLPCHRSKF